LRSLAPGRRTYALAFALLVFVALCVATASAAMAASSGGAGVVPPPPQPSPPPATGEGSGGTTAPGPIPVPTTPLPTAQLSADGRTAIAPASAPLEVKNAIFAANQITHKPYRYGGGHRAWKDRGYDCSGSVSYALHGGGLLTSPLPSSSFMRWGLAGHGLWITIYTNPGHAYLIIAGLRFDTSGPGERGPRWRKSARSSRTYVARHPVGF
jgi:cell wall-associated NlpC family hydrolase